MNEKRIPLTDEEPKHKKKSTAKGLPRSKHKHQYETVLLSHFYHHPDIHTGKEKTMEIRIPTKVCMICGLIISKYQALTRGLVPRKSLVKRL